MGAKVIHVEVTGKDGPALQRFYSQVFGWTLDTSGPGGYGMARGVADGDFTAGIGGTQDGSAGQATFYVHADDPKAALHQVEAQPRPIVQVEVAVAYR